MYIQVPYTLLRNRTFSYNRKINSSILRVLLGTKEEANQPIAHYLFQSNWKHLQHLDSQLVDLVLEAGTKECIPVHDSFIVSTKHPTWLESQIYAAYKKMTGFEAKVALEDTPDLSELESQLFHYKQ